MDEPWEHYAQWNKSDTKGHIFYDFIYAKYLKCLNLGKHKADQCFPGSQWLLNGVLG